VNASQAAAKGKENHMFNIDVEEIEWGGKKLRLETGRMARRPMAP
jgi:hypothetical protein